MWTNRILSLAAIEYDGELSTSAYLLLAGMLLFLVGGFAWCFYRAINAAGNEEEQVADDE
jgi:hypothetical protein